MEENIYIRGGDEIDLDTLLSSLKSNFDSWLDTRNLSNQEKADVRMAYNDLFAQFQSAPSNFKYDSDNRAFSTTSKFPDTPAYRRAAGYLGEVIRTSPRKEKDKDKDVWNQNSKFITEDIQNSIISDPNSFRALDSSNPYSYTNRLNKIIDYINNNLNTIIDQYSYSSEENRNKATEQLKQYLNNLQDTTDTSDDSYILSQLGFTNPTEILRVEALQEPTPEDPQKQYRAIFQEWAELNHPLNAPSSDIYNFKGVTPEAIDYNTVGDNISEALNFIFQGSMQNNLGIALSIVLGALNNKDYTDLGGGKYIIGNPDLLNEVYVYDNTNATLTKRNAWDFEKYKKQYFDEFLRDRGQDLGYNPYDRLLANLLQSTQSHKNGGILKFQGGGNTPTDQNYWMRNYVNPSDTSSTYDLNYELPGWSDNSHNSRDTSIGNKNLFKPTPQESLDLFNKYANSTNLAGDVKSYYNTWRATNQNKSLQEFIDTYNNNVAKLRENSRKMFTSGYGPGNQDTDWREYNQLYNLMYSSRGKGNANITTGVLGYSSNQENILGQTTFARVPSLFSDDNQFKGYRSLTLNDQRIWINNNGMLETQPTTETPETPSSETTPAPAAAEPTPAGGNSQLQEEQVEGGHQMPWDMTSTANLFDNRTNSKFYKGELQNAIMSGGRLGYSLATNQKIKDIMNKSLQPFTQDPYRLYSPITGDLGARMMASRQAALNRQAVNRPITTDSNKMMSYIFEANRQADDIEERGRLADNAKIDKSRQEALARQEANTKLENQVANANRKAILDTNRERAELEATNKKINWKSVDDYLKNIESRLISRKDMQLAKEIESLERTAGMQAEYSREAAINAVRSRYYEYASRHPGITETQFNALTNGDYFQALRDANNYVTWGYQGNLNRIYGIPYNFSHIGVFDPVSQNYIWNNPNRWEQLLNTDPNK